MLVGILLHTLNLFTSEAHPANFDHIKKICIFDLILWHNHIRPGAFISLFMGRLSYEVIFILYFQRNSSILSSESLGIYCCEC